MNFILSSSAKQSNQYSWISLRNSLLSKFFTTIIARWINTPQHQITLLFRILFFFYHKTTFIDRSKSFATENLLLCAFNFIN